MGPDTERSQRLSVNREAMLIVRKIMADAPALGVAVTSLGNGSTVIDMGVNCDGGWRAAKLFCEATFGGLGTLEYGVFDLDGLQLPEVRIFVDRPPVALLSSQISGWPLNEFLNDAGVVPLISGPVRAVAQRDMFCKAVDYRDEAGEVVVALQDNALPGETLTALIAGACGISPAGVFVMVAPTRSLVGSINVVARTLETSIWRLRQFGVDINNVASAWGSAPLPPLAADEFTAMVRTNTFTYYGGTAGFYVRSSDEIIERALKDFPLAPHTCECYGVPFGALLKQAGGDIFAMKGFVHNVAKGIVNNMDTGRVFVTGAIDKRILLDCIYDQRSRP